MWYAIRHKKTGKFLYGTDFNYDKPRQRLTDNNSPPKLFDDYNLELELYRRRINLRLYEVVEIELTVKNVKKGVKGRL